MRYLNLFLVTLILFTACSKQHFQNDKVFSKSCTYQPYMRIDSFLNTSKGEYYYSNTPDSNRMVFLYENGYIVKNTDDAGGGFELVFQIDNKLESFTYRDDELKQHLTYYESYEGWGGSDQMLIEKGIITGQKQADGTWQIGIGVGLPRPDNILNINTVNDNIIATKYQPYK